MKTFTLLFFLSFSAFGQTVEYRCYNEDNNQSLNFILNNEQQTIRIVNNEALQYVQLPTEKELKYTTNYNSIYFEYDWYYTAWFKMDFTTPVDSHKAGDSLEMHLFYDDNDGAWEDNVVFHCSI